MKIGVYNRYWRTGGGAETYGAAVAQVLARHHDVDLLGPDDVDLDHLAERMRRAVGEAAARAGCSAEILDVWNWGGAIFAPELIDQVRSASLAMGYRTQDILSQAGHDAYFVARHAPTTMIFAPCKGGITHNNEENCDRDDLEPGLNVLLQAVVARADR